MSAEVSDLDRRAGVHAALADRHRLAIVDRLTLSDVSPSELAAELGIGANLLAHHLGILEGAGLVERRPSEGDGRRRYVRLSWPVLEAVAAPGGTLAADGILFVCTGNSARSQLAAALWNRLGRVPAESAGTHPATRVHPLAIRVGTRAGLDLRRSRPRPLSAVAHPPGLVVTVCDRAHEELERSSATPPTLHWSVPDPVAIGSRAAFDDALADLRERVGRLAPHVPPAPTPVPKEDTR